MSILELPTELLDHIFAYLDWDRTKSLEPQKVDIVNASLTCKLLRKALEPIVFRDVVLRLRWVDEALVEPLLYRLRREKPALADHIRSVSIRAEFELCLHCAQKEDPAAFVVPQDVKDWLNPSGASPFSHDDQEKAYRSQVDVLAQTTLSPLFAYSIKPPSEPAEEAILSFKRRDGRNPDIDALSIVMLCIPASTNTIIFRSLTDNYVHETKNNFAVRVLATALDLHSQRIRDLTMISNAAAGRLTMSRRALARLGTGGGEQEAVTANVLRNLQTRKLTIAVGNNLTFQRSGAVSMQGYHRWHQMSHCVRLLELRYTNTDLNEMSNFVKGFKQLETVRVQQCVLRLPHHPLPPGRTDEVEASTWLSFAIDLRRSMQHVKIELSQLHRANGYDLLSDCATRWIVSQAVPLGCLIDADREERLLHDYASFAELWKAEQSERGSQALVAWDTLRGKLSDDAMSRRWR